MHFRKFYFCAFFFLFMFIVASINEVNASQDCKNMKNMMDKYDCEEEKIESE